jgi:hypothetical protein
MPASQHSLLFKLACKAMRYFLMGVFGVLLFCILSSGMGALHVAVLVISTVGTWLVRSAILVSGFMAAAVVYESWRQ